MRYLVSTMDWHSFVLEDSLRPSAYTCRSLILVMNCIVFIAFVWLWETKLAVCCLFLQAPSCLWHLHRRHPTASTGFSLAYRFTAGPRPELDDSSANLISVRAYQYEIRTRLKRNRFTRQLVHNVRYSAVRINSSLLTVTLEQHSFITTQNIQYLLWRTNRLRLCNPSYPCVTLPIHA